MIWEKVFRLKSSIRKYRKVLWQAPPQVNVEEFVEFFEPFLKNGQDILHISLSSRNLRYI